jgi:hypothetical protein
MKKQTTVCEYDEHSPRSRHRLKRGMTCGKHTFHKGDVVYKIIPDGPKVCPFCDRKLK